MDVSCSICSENYYTASDVRALNCGHVFHYDCITSWLERASSCPQCRKPVAILNLHRIFLNFENNEHDCNPTSCYDADVSNQMEMLQIENDSLRDEIRNTTEKLEEMEVINLSLQDMETDKSKNDAEQMYQQLQYALGQNVLLETDLEKCKNEITELKIKNLTLTDEILPNARQLIEKLEEQLHQLNITEQNTMESSSVENQMDSFKDILHQTENQLKQINIEETCNK